MLTLSTLLAGGFALQWRACDQIHQKGESELAEHSPGRKQTLGEMLSTASSPVAVPEWQRSFSWGDIEVRCLWLDLLAFSERYEGLGFQKREYSLGSVVIAHHDRVHVLLDGQHRLASATILLSVIRDHLARQGNPAAIDIQHNYICGLNGATSICYKLTMNRIDRDFFRREIQDEARQERPWREPHIESHRLLWKARNLLADLFEAECIKRNLGAQAAEWVERVLDALLNYTTVSVLETFWTTSIRLPGAPPHCQQEAVLQSQ
jgi:hypothetical protein